MINIKSITVYQINLPLKYPFETSLNVLQNREVIVLKVTNEDGRTGWGEIVAFSSPWYTEETLQSALYTLKKFLAPLVLEKPLLHPVEAAQLFNVIRGNHMAKSGLEGALWDLYSKLQKKSLSFLLGGRKHEVDAGVVIGLSKIENMIDDIHLRKEQGYKRFKVKIKPGNDVKVIAQIREEFPTIPLMVDANGTYTLKELSLLKQLDQFNLLMIEQPFLFNDFTMHAELQKRMGTPICLDESINSLSDAKTAIALKSCKVMTIKPGKVGGLTEATNIHHLCREHNIPVWVGGMVETGISKSQNIALATLPNFTIPGDISESSRFFEQDILKKPITIHEGKSESSYSIWYRS
ncbi:o-succinylbenzoate synthase [Bacillus carboniphilus]|uniref:o-succinylbenzoate synthase n=1 Tax=Bacillus carboniphilus TaxID=86663 RepID=A0ABY9JP58_9BACI|nr:o-succinylbenzoate synthase [Bacillus carboniphilus]WLR41196.1 o-succinylbenzoate synthase [Bacillus carboniphilus]